MRGQGGSQQLRSYLHAKARARLRYGVEVDPFSYRTLCRQIVERDGARARFIGSLEGGVEAWLVLHGTTWMVAAWKRGRIATFLDPGQEFGRSEEE